MTLNNHRTQTICQEKCDIIYSFFSHCRIYRWRADDCLYLFVKRTRSVVVTSSFDNDKFFAVKIDCNTVFAKSKKIDNSQSAYDMFVLYLCEMMWISGIVTNVTWINQWNGESKVYFDDSELMTIKLVKLMDVKSMTSLPIYKYIYDYVLYVSKSPRLRTLCFSFCANSTMTFAFEQFEKYANVSSSRLMDDKY